MPRPLRDDTDDQAEYVAYKLTIGLPEVFAPPVTAIVSRDLKAGVIDLHPVTLRFAYVYREEQAGVTWTAGRAPGKSDEIPHADFEYRPAEVGLSESTAALLDVTVGDMLSLTDPDGAPVVARVSGVFVPVDVRDPEWTVVPTLLEPTVIDGSLPRIEVAAMVTGESLPYAIHDLKQGAFSRTYTYRVEPERLDASNAAGAAAAIRALVASPNDFGITWESPSLRTRLDFVIDDALARVRSANAQGSLVLAGVLATALLVLLLASDLVVQRRARVLAHQRSHGASLPAIARALAVESAVMTALGWGLGLGIAGLVIPGETSWGWVLPPLAFAFAAGPILGGRAAARRTAPPPARRLDARSGAAPAAVRRLAAEATVAVLAIGALVALSARGATAAGDTIGSDLIVLAAPTLAAGAVALALARLLPPAWAWLRRAASHSRSAAPVLASARIRTSALPLASFVLATALLTIALAMGATVRAGVVAGSWETMGADAVASSNEASGLPSEVADLGASPGVEASAAAHVVDGKQVLGRGTDSVVRFVAVDSGDFEKLLASSPLADAPQLEALAADRAPGSPIPALTSGLAKNASDLTIAWGDDRIALVSVGIAPALPGDPPGAEPTVIVDRATLEAASGIAAAPDVAWVTGKGAESALRALAGLGDFDIATREEWLAARRTAPVTAAFGGLLVAAAAVLLALAILVVGLMSAAGARGRASALAGFRVLGLPRSDIDKIAIGETLVPVVTASVVGAATGAALGAWLAGPLDLAALTGQNGTPTFVLPWWCWMSVPVLVVAVLVAVVVELAGHRRERLGQVMRAG